MITPWIGGYPLSSICRYSQVNWTDRWPYGNWDATIQLHVSPRFRHPAIRTDAPCELRWGKAVFAGRLSEPNWETGLIAISGTIRQGEGYLGINIEPRTDDPIPGLHDYLVPSRNLEQAIDDAIDGGPSGVLPSNSEDEITDRTPLAWKRTDPLWSSDLYDPTVIPTEYQYLFPALIDLAATRGAGTPYMGGDGRLRFLETPTEPTWVTQPSFVDLAEAAGESRITTVIVHFLDSTELDKDDHRWLTDTRFVPHREQYVDARALGPMTPTEALDIAEAILDEHLRPVFINDIPLTPLLASRYGGSPCWPVTARAGQIVRVQGATHPRLSGNHIDFIAGEMAISNAETTTPTAVAKPLNRPPRTLEEVTEQTLRAVREAAAA